MSYTHWAYGKQSGATNGDIINIDGGAKTLHNVNVRAITQAEIEASQNPGTRQPGPIYLKVTGGTTLATDDVQVNDTATLTIQGTTAYQENLFGSNGKLIVGYTDDSDSSMSISNAKVVINQGTATNQNMVISVVATSKGTLTIGDGGWLDTTVGEANYIAHNGTGVLDILKGGKFTSRTNEANTIQKWGTQVAFYSGSEGHLNVAGGTFDVEHHTTVGGLGKGYLNVTQGGTAEMTELYIGGRTMTALAAGSGEGYVTIGGVGESNSGTLSANTIYIAHAMSENGTDTPHGTLEVIQGTVTTNHLWLSVNSRAAMPESADAKVILHEGGTIHVQNRLDMAVQANTHAEMEISGGELIVGSATTSGELNVGGAANGTGKIVIENGGVLETTVGFDWNDGGGNSIGHYGTGEIVVEEGGTFRTTLSSSGGWAATTLGGWGATVTNGTGTLSVNGGTFVSEGLNMGGNTLHVGTLGTGYFNIRGKANVDVEGRVCVTDLSDSQGTVHVSGSQADIRFDSLALVTKNATLRFSGDSGGFSTIYVNNTSTMTSLSAPIVIHDDAKIEVGSGAGIAVFSEPTYTLIETSQGFANARIASTEGNWGVVTDGLKLVATPQNGVVLPMNQRYSFLEPAETGWFEIEGTPGENWALTLDVANAVDQELETWLESIEWGDSVIATVLDGSSVLLSGLRMNTLGTAYLSWDMTGTGMGVTGLYAQSVPEPASWVLFFLGVMGLWGYRKGGTYAKK
ncbi:MAG: PEP-CTERM sorting domain-containing protein [Planctomycetia bacterium]|nr:PEP-CTERM sorting domain-containing protein [Planctomycetia bacterium]